MSNNHEHHIGLDISANSIKAVVLSPNKSRFKVEKFYHHNFQDTIIENGIIKDYSEMVKRISEVAGNISSCKKVALALKGPAVIVRKILVNNSSLGDLKEFRWVANQYTSVEPEEMCIDFETLPYHDLYNHTNILMTAANKDIITDYVSALETSKLEPYVIEGEAMAITRLFKALNKEKNKETQLIIHIGSMGSFVIFIRNGFFDYCKEVSRGGKYFTDMIKHDLDVDTKTAERIKINPESYSNPEKAYEVLDKIFSLEYAQEIDYILKFYLLRDGSMPNNIYLSGRHCQTYGLEKALLNKFSIPVKYLDPWKLIELPSNVGKIEINEKYNYSVALGLALYGISE